MIIFPNIFLKFLVIVITLHEIAFFPQLIISHKITAVQCSYIVTAVHIWLQLFTYEYSCSYLITFTYDYSCSHMITAVHIWLQLFIYDYSCSSIECSFLDLFNAKLGSNILCFLWNNKNKLICRSKIIDK